MKRGHALVFTTRDRPVQSQRGWSPSPVRHGVSTVRSGIRHTLGLVFHDAPERRPAERVLRTLDTSWAAFQESYAALPDAALLEPGAVGDWSVKDVLAHVNTWQEEALDHLPVIAAGGTPPRYATIFGGIDAFNALPGCPMRLATPDRSQGGRPRRYFSQACRQRVYRQRRQRSVMMTGPD